MNGVLIGVGVLAATVVLALLVLALMSRSGQPPGLLDGRLAPCPETPNCVSSEPGADAGHAIAPLTVSDQRDLPAVLRAAVESLGGRLVAVEGDYLAASFRSSLFGFVDDLELRIDRDAGVVQVRSASRVGRSDLGVNRRRVEALRARLAARH